MTLLRLVLRGLKPYWIWVLMVVLFQIVGVLAALYLPTLNADIIDDGVAKADVPVIWELGQLMLLISFGNIIALVAANFFAARSAMKTGKDLRSEVFAKVSSFSPRELAEFGTPSLITRSTNDVQQVQMLIFFSLNMLVQAPVTGIGGGGARAARGAGDGVADRRDGAGDAGGRRHPDPQGRPAVQADAGQDR